MTREPYPDVASHLRDELRRAWLRIEYQVRLAWSKSRQVASEVSTMNVLIVLP